MQYRDFMVTVTMRHLFRNAVFLTTILSSAGCHRGEESSELLFRARPDEAIVPGSPSTHTVAQGPAREDEFLVVKRHGTFHRPGRPIPVVAKAEVDLRTLAGAISSNFSAYKARDIDWMVSNYIEPQREGKQRILELVRQNQLSADAWKNAAENVMSREVWGTIEDGDDRIVVIGQNGEEPSGIIEIYRSTPAGWLLVDRPPRDQTVTIIRAAVRNHRVAKVR